MAGYREWAYSPQLRVARDAVSVAIVNAAGPRGYLFKGGNLLHFLKEIKPELDRT